jgi:ADP-ribose pyrophosphatase YjhB (NUDIX family)
MKTLKAKIPVCKAGGGFVHNKRVRFCLFSGTENGIYLRWNRKGEEIEDTAMREVEEETGVNQLRLQKTTKNVSHFKRNGKYKLKITHWFEMESSFEGVPKVS